MRILSKNQVLGAIWDKELGYWLFGLAKKYQFVGIVDYNYPLLETLLLCIALIIGQLLIVFFVKKRIGKESLIDRIRSGE